MIEIITSFDKRYYDLIGKDCVSSFLEFWYPEFSLTCYTEGFQLDPHERLKQIDFDHEVDPEYALLQADTAYGVQVKKFSKKAFSFIHAMYHSTADWILWLDAGQPDTLFQSAAYVKTIQERQGIRIGCVEEECYNKGFINKNQLKKVIDKLPKSEYKSYLQKYE